MLGGRGETAAKEHEHTGLSREVPQPGGGSIPMVCMHEHSIPLYSPLGMEKQVSPTVRVAEFQAEKDVKSEQGGERKPSYVF